MWGGLLETALTDCTQRLCHTPGARWRDGRPTPRLAACSSDARRRRRALNAWRAYLQRRRQAALASSLALEHCRATLLRRCTWGWLQLAQHAAARDMHIQGMREHQALMQVRRHGAVLCTHAQSLHSPLNYNHVLTATAAAGTSPVLLVLVHALALALL